MVAPAVSVILPTYQRRVLVSDAIRRVVAQTFEDWELIVVDDGSTDGTEAAVAAIGDIRVRYRWQPNAGLCAARNAGLRLARGVIVAFLDSDDRWRRNHLELVAAVFRRYPEALLVSTNPRWVLRGSDPPERARLVDALPGFFLGNHVGCPSAVSVRRHAVLELGGFDEGIDVAEDDELWYRLAVHGPFAFLQHRTVERTHGSDSLVRRRARDGRIPAALERIAEHGLEELRRVRGEGNVYLVPAEGKLAFARALRALVAGDEALLRNELSAACRLLPELHREPGALLVAIQRLLPESESAAGRLGYYAAAAAAWPEQRTDTAVVLRAYAFSSALRAARLTTAAAQLRRLHLPSAGRLLVHRYRDVLAIGRRWCGQGPAAIRRLRRT